MLRHSNGDALRFSHVKITRDCRSVRRAIGLISAEAGPSGKRGTGSHTENVFADLPAAGLLKFLPHNFSNSPQNSHNEAGIDPWCVKCVEEFGDLHADKNFRFRDMMAVAGVSEQTLYVYFRRCCVVSAGSYLKSAQIDSVPTQPLLLSSKNLNVSEIVREYGFRHIGNLGEDYSTRLGEKPSEIYRF